MCVCVYVCVFVMVVMVVLYPLHRYFLIRFSHFLLGGLLAKDNEGRFSTHRVQDDELSRLVLVISLVLVTHNEACSALQAGSAGDG